MKNIPKLLGSRIKHLRERRNLTQESLSEKININPVYLSNIERGKANPTLNVLAKTSLILEVEMWELFDNRHEVGNRELKEMLKLLASSIKNEDQLRLAVRMLQIITK